MDEYLLAKTVFRELFLANQEIDVTVSLTQKDVEGILKVFNWKRKHEVNNEEFKQLSTEWNKTCKLLTSGNFFLNISHNPDLFHERWFVSISKDCYPHVQDRKKELEFIVAARREGYLEKVMETPFLGYDFNGKPIYSLEEDQVQLILKCYRFIDPDDTGVVLRPALFSFYMLHRQCNMAKGIELSQAKSGKELNSSQSLVSDFEECLAQTSLQGRELYSTRECMNFLCKLTNSQLVSGDTLLKKAIELYSHLRTNFHSNFSARLTEEVKKLLVGPSESHAWQKSDLSAVLMFLRADFWSSVSKFRENGILKDLSPATEDIIGDCLLNSYISFRKTLSVLVGEGQCFKVVPSFKAVLFKLYSAASAVQKSWERVLYEFFGIKETRQNSKSERERSEARSSELQSDNDNTTIYSILKDYKDLHVNPRDSGARNLGQPDEDIVLSDFSNFGYPKLPAYPPKKSANQFNLMDCKAGDEVAQDKAQNKTQKSMPPLDSKTKTRTSSRDAPPKSPGYGAHLPTEAHQYPQNSIHFFNSANAVSESKLARLNGINFEEEFSRLFPLQPKQDSSISAAAQRKSSVERHQQSSPKRAILLEPSRTSSYNNNLSGGASSKLAKEKSIRGKDQDHYLSRDVSKENLRPSRPFGNSSKQIEKSKERTTKPPLEEHKNAKPSSHFYAERSRSKDLILPTSNLLHELSQIEAETPQDSSSVDLYIPKVMRKKKKDEFVFSKVDHRRDKSQSKSSQNVSILEKQFKFAQIESFETVMTNLKGSYHKTSYDDHKKGFLK